ncbi:pyridoxal-phosphate dependent enzyme [Paraflavisolibacter sp. H34]|uniref:1-aminocyclopropane-1-carboxylate deaminase/D-cysteine desulfhydrase n=1 Tax=Huijunlia imazamoxiresistens TaxID=3127457 RepID=UPI00301890AF
MRLKEQTGPRIDRLPPAVLQGASLRAGVLRLDAVHPEVSGNKWYKLKEYISEARLQQQNTLLTFGGPYSNHIAATAAACREFGFRCVGLIRGERPPRLSPTLQRAQEQGMDLVFISRADYAAKNIPAPLLEQYPDACIIDEGGYGLPGRRGAESILDSPGCAAYSHLLAAVGTGTTLAGLVEAAGPQQQVTGISVLKNNTDLLPAINALLSPHRRDRFTLLHDFHFGGYAKSTPALLEFMNDWYRQTGIPSDFVYTGKLFYAFQQLCALSYFPPGSNVLVVHSGGLQGNCSLNKGTLLF